MHLTNILVVVSLWVLAGCFHTAPYAFAVKLPPIVERSHGRPPVVWWIAPYWFWETYMIENTFKECDARREFLRAAQAAHEYLEAKSRTLEDWQIGVLWQIGDPSRAAQFKFAQCVPLR